ncbi:MAG TPA: transcription termination factor Rho, partial [Thermoanaerobaculia bacterium]
MLYIPPKENQPGVLVASSTNYLPTPKDPIVPRDLIAREGLEAGALIGGFAADGGRPVVKRIDTVEGLTPAQFRQRPAFQELVS